MTTWPFKSPQQAWWPFGRLKRPLPKPDSTAGLPAAPF